MLSVVAGRMVPVGRTDETTFREPGGPHSRFRPSRMAMVVVGGRMRLLARGLAGVAFLSFVVWGGLALAISGPRPDGLARVLAAAWVLCMALAAFFVRPAWVAALGCAALSAMLLLWWGTVRPSNDRDWQVDVARAPWTERNGDLLTIHGVRNFRYRSPDDFDPRWEDRTYDLSKIVGLDLALSYWGPTAIAHAIMIWEFADGQFLPISIETRKEKGEEYSALAGFFRKYEIVYVPADEHDLVLLRTNHRRENVYLYRLATSPGNARRLLEVYAADMDRLAKQPEFYNAVTTNCTTQVFRNFRALGIPVPLDWRIFANGHLDELLWEIGAISREAPFDEIRHRSSIDDRAHACGDVPEYSSRIREGLPARPSHPAYDSAP